MTEENYHLAENLDRRNALEQSTSQRHSTQRRTLLKGMGTLGAAGVFGLSTFSGSAAAQQAGGWFPMEFDATTDNYSIEWTAPSTADPAGLLGNVYFRAFRSDGSQIGPVNLGLAINPAFREFEFAMGNRLGGGVVVEPDPNAADPNLPNLLGIEVGGRGLQPGNYELEISADEATEPVTFSFTADAAGDVGATLGPNPTSLPSDESLFTITINGPEGEQVIGPGTTPPEAEPGSSVDVPNTGARFRIFEPQVDAGEFELVGSSTENPAVYPFRVQVLEGDGTVLTDANVEWQALINGEIQQPGTVPGQPPRIIEIRGTGTRADYTFSVGGTLQPGSGLTGEDTILGRTATGAVRGRTDQYQFTGSITDFGFDSGSADVFVGDSPDTLAQVDPNTFFLNNRLVILGQGQRANYDVTTSSRLAGQRLTQEDEIVFSTRTGSRASGAVRGRQDEYLFNGSITGFGADAPVRVFVGPADGTLGERPAGSFGLPNTLEIAGQGTRANYNFSVSGSLQGQGLTREDTITGSSATGAVRGGTDSYRFSGRIGNFTVSGPVTVRLNGETVDPATL